MYKIQNECKVYGNMPFHEELKKLTSEYLEMVQMQDSNTNSPVHYIHLSTDAKIKALIV